MRVLDLLDAGAQPYLRMDSLQRALHADVAAGTHESTLIAWHGEPTYTAGRHVREEDIVDDVSPLVHTDRAGSVTWHGPGQLVIYPIVKLATPVDSLKYIRAVERSVLDVLRDTYGLPVERIDGRAGVWLRNPDRKISAIGLKISRNATLHGVSLNVATDPATAFAGIVPCGLSDSTVTSMAEEGVTGLTLAEVAEPLIQALTQNLNPLLDDATDSITRITDSQNQPTPIR